MCMFMHVSLCVHACWCEHKNAGAMEAIEEDISPPGPGTKDGCEGQFYTITDFNDSIQMTTKFQRDIPDGAFSVTVACDTVWPHSRTS